MEIEAKKENLALNGKIVPTFFKYLIPSMLSLIAMTSASLVDGIFIGNYVGVTALGAVNLTIPVTALLFGFAMMLSVGGSVRAGKYLGEKDYSAASSIFSKTLISVVVYGVLAISLGLFFELELFAGLGANEELFPVMSEYYRVILPFLLAQFVVIVMYFFIRLDGFPNLVAVALTVGALVNILLDYLFIGVLGFGLRGAAYATGISQALPMLVMMAYFISPDRTMEFSVRQGNWREVLQAAYNGISEFINEISGGIIVLIFNWMLLQRFGVVGVAAITVVNYLLMLGFMMFFSISDTIQVMVSQNFGARNALRMVAFLKTACISIFALSSIFIIIILSFSEPLISIFVNGEDSEEMVAMALDFVTYVWPVFLFSGTNMLISGYLTAIHLPFQSGMVALCRSLVFPTAFLIILYLLVSDYRFVAAIPLAEFAAFTIALVFFFQHLPEKAVRDIR